MSDETTNHGHSGHGVEFEREDLSSRGVFGFMIGLAIIGVVIYFIITGMYTFLDKYEKSQMSAASPLVKSEDSAQVGSRRVTQDYVERKFKENGAPLLEVDERGQLHDFVMNQEKQLNSYGWVDEKAGVAHIPIERAMELTIQRGLPVRPQGGAVEASTAPKTANARKAPPKQ
ncbi:MAG: hypothetical protein HY233_01970 [Acidobacteriales bacterium]|nr:hypothetical protein [Candidatus Koribacter versatilis]MBI3644723.1 hypothetical protein [Terriglobales bacterium]